MTFPERFFAIEGDKADQENLTRWFSTGDDRVVHYRGSYYLMTTLPQSASDEDALSVGHEVFATMIGAAFAIDGQAPRVRLAGLSRQDSKTGDVTTPTVGTVGLIAKKPIMAMNAVVAGDADEPPAASPGESLLGLAEATAHLQRALYLLGRLNHDWRNLYMAVEAMEDANGGESGLKAKPWAGRLKAFKDTANSYKALKHDARHGSTKKGSDKPKMTLVEAREFVLQALRGWINELRAPERQPVVALIMSSLRDMSTWTERLGRTKLRTFTDAEGLFWLEQNPDKGSKWAKFARKGHDVAWEFEKPGGTYTGRMLIDGEIYTPSEATKKFLKR